MQLRCKTASSSCFGPVVSVHRSDLCFLIHSRLLVFLHTSVGLVVFEMLYVNHAFIETSWDVIRDMNRELAQSPTAPLWQRDQCKLANTG